MKLFKRKAPELTRRQRIERGSAPVNYSYYSRRSQTIENTGRDTGRQLFKPSTKQLGSYWLQRFGLLVLLLSAVACLVSSSMLSTNPKVITLPGDEGAALLQNPIVYQQAAQRLLTSSLLNHSKITINTNQLASQMQAQFPELESVAITLPLLAHRPIVYIQPVRPVLVLSTANGSFVVDSTGKALLPSTSLVTASRDKLPTVVDQSGLKVEPDHLALPSTTVAFIQMVTLQLQARSFTIASMTLPAASQELDVRLADKPFAIKFNLADSDHARSQAGTFLATFAQLQEQGVTPGNYIDVRLVGRAYYK